MALIPKKPQLQKNGMYDPIELSNYVDQCVGTILIAETLVIAGLMIVTLVQSERLANEREKNATHK